MRERDFAPSSEDIANNGPFKAIADSQVQNDRLASVSSVIDLSLPKNDTLEKQ